MALLSILTLSAFSAINTNTFAQAAGEQYFEEPLLIGSGQIATAHWDGRFVNGISTNIDAFFAERLTIDDKVVLNGLYISVFHRTTSFYSGNYISVSDSDIEWDENGISAISVSTELDFSNSATSSKAHKINLDWNFDPESGSAIILVTEHTSPTNSYRGEDKNAVVSRTDPVVSAYVTKLNGNKNDLTITVNGIFNFIAKDVSVIPKTFSINNNAAGTYAVGSYNVYVDTKGNDQIRACYIVK